MAVSDCGRGNLFARNVQEAADLAAIARRVVEATETPFEATPEVLATQADRLANWRGLQELAGIA
jgi:hypothetical protein